MVAHTYKKPERGGVDDGDNVWVERNTHSYLTGFAVKYHRGTVRSAWPQNVLLGTADRLQGRGIR